MAANRATVQVKRDNINVKGTLEVWLGMYVTGMCRARQSRNPALFFPHVLKCRLTMFCCPFWNIK